MSNLKIKVFFWAVAFVLPTLVCAAQENPKQPDTPGEIILIADRQSKFCSTAMPEGILASIFPERSMNALDYRDAAAVAIIKKYGVKELPCFLLPEDISQEDNFARISHLLGRNTDKYLLDRSMSGLFLFLERPVKSKQVDYFLNFYSKRAGDILPKLADYCVKNKVELDIHFIFPEKAKFVYQRQEAELALAVKKIAPEKFYDYLYRRLANVTGLYWIDALEDSKVPYHKVKDVVKSAQMDKMIQENAALARELGISDGDVILVNNRRVARLTSVNDADLTKLLEEDSAEAGQEKKPEKTEKGSN